jgi:hypothetical protein
MTRTGTGWRLSLRTDGATDSEIAAGLAAAQAVFDKAGVIPFDAAAAIFKRDGEREDLTDSEVALVHLWEYAEEAASQACSADVIALELLRPGET